MVATEFSHDRFVTRLGIRLGRLDPGTLGFDQVAGVGSFRQLDPDEQVLVGFAGADTVESERAVGDGGGVADGQHRGDLLAEARPRRPGE